jgi:hypothetical protein
MSNSTFKIFVFLIFTALILTIFIPNACAEDKTAWELFQWGKPDHHLAYPQDRKLNQSELNTLSKVQLPNRYTLAPLVTLIRSQGSGGCGAMTMVAILDLLKKNNFRYTPNISYRFLQYFYDGSKSAPKEYWLDQADVAQLIGVCPEGHFNSDYDISPPAPPSNANFSEAHYYRIGGYSDLIKDFTVDNLKRMLVHYGPVAALGDVPGSPAHGHVFAIIGYDDATRNFTIVNSYGDQWGTNGMMDMPYANIANPPANQTSPRVDHIRYIWDDGKLPAFPYSARINIEHNIARHHLIVKIGAVGQTAETVWNHPNKTSGLDDTSRNLVIDVPLPRYASQYWPPSEEHRWLVEISDDSGVSPVPRTIATVRDIVLVYRAKKNTGEWLPVLYRPSLFSNLNQGGTITVKIPTVRTEVLNLAVDHPTLKAGEVATFSGVLNVKLERPDGTWITSKLANQKIELQSVKNDPLEGTILLGVVGRDTTDKDGKYSIGHKISKSGSYQAFAVGDGGKVDANSEIRSVQVIGATPVTPLRPVKPVRPLTPPIRKTP